VTEAALEWMSFRRDGKIADLAFAFPSISNGRRFIDNLVTLGHAEWTALGSWRIAPPALAGLPAGPLAGAVLCGARTAGVLRSLKSGCDAAGIELHIEEQVDRPALITITHADPDAVAFAASQSGIPFQPRAALALLCCTPSIREWPRVEIPMVEGKVETIRRFSKSRMRWVPSTLAEATHAPSGLYRIQRDWDWVSVIKSSPSHAARIDDRAGRMAASAKCKVVRWTGRDLALPWQLYPPTLIARSLALCSGRLPRFEAQSREVVFSGVASDHLRAMLALTGLKLV
jgi:hypothetical protein